MEKKFIDREGYYIDKCGMCINYPINDISKATSRGYVCPYHNSGWFTSSIGMAFDDSCSRQRNDRYRTHKDIKKAFEKLDRKCGYSPKSYWNYIMTVIKDILNTEEALDAWIIMDSLRMNFMYKNLKYVGLLVSYDIYGRMIADALKNDPDNKKIAQAILDVYIKKVISLIMDGKIDAAIYLYQRMVAEMRKYYQILDLKDYKKETSELVRVKN